VETVREPLVILNQNLQVVQANQAFNEAFEIFRAETEDRLSYDLGNKQWNIPKLRELLENIIPAPPSTALKLLATLSASATTPWLLTNAQARTILLAIGDAAAGRPPRTCYVATNAGQQRFAFALAYGFCRRHFAWS
jgi:hypothetical protein